MKYLTLILGLLITGTIAAQGVIGKWKTVDDETGKTKSIVEIYERDGMLFGKVVEILWTQDGNLDPYCSNCSDERKDKRVTGMEIIRDMEKDDDEWDDGTILDPKNGKIYDCKLWLDEDDINKLHVRGYIAFFFRTQEWIRAL